MVISWKSWMDDQSDRGDEAGQRGRHTTSGLDTAADGCNVSLSEGARVSLSPERRAERRMDEGSGVS